MEACIIDRETLREMIREVRENLTLIHLAYNGLWLLETIEKKEAESFISAVSKSIKKLDDILKALNGFNPDGIDENSRYVF